MASSSRTSKKKTSFRSVVKRLMKLGYSEDRAKLLASYGADPERATRLKGCDCGTD